MPENNNEEIRIGVYTCYCGGNISDAVDCEKVRETLEKLPNVVVSRTDMSMCSDAGQAKIEEDIRELGVNRIVVGACAPSLHEQTFRGTVARSGLNPYLYHHVGLREQDSWVHHGNREQATEKAIVLMRAGIAKARLLEQLEPIRLDAQQHALVIGGGVAGLRSALDIARQGIRVTLIEKTPFLGGHMAQLDTVFPTNKPAQADLHDLIEKVLVHPNITVHTNAQLTGMSGYVGDYQAKIQVQARGVYGEIADQEAVLAVCPVEVPDEFNYGLTTRKAIYQTYPESYPPTLAIDWQNCTRCGECAKIASANIDLEGRTETITVNVGAIVVATGFKPYEPRQGEYGYGENPEVITLPQLIRLLALNKTSDQLTYNGRPIKNIGLVHCVGSRHIPGVHEPQADGKVNDYCSRYCCTATLHTANELRQRYPELNIFDVYEDIRTYGRGHEEYYLEASKDKVTFLRFHAQDSPQVVAAPEGEDHPVIIKIHDQNTWGMELEVPVDLVVLSVGMMPNPVDDLIRLLKINAGTDRFLLEVHPKLRPVETAVRGVVLAGTAQGPMNIQESCAAASAAAAKVAVLLRKGVVELEPFVAQVNLDLCNGTGACVEVCPYEDAIALESFEVNGQQVKRAVVTPANCAGCGSCVSACPNRAIDLQGWTLGQYEAMVDAIALDMETLEVSA
ncbi:MAG: CoB--CoM heterodisulfide reductase iron-sulfur subunit A family protein [Anaerolineales bacterium]|nr:CoB--CoM heterodisulfide reductase iron-sulfur subunit A family protein [Anaerolineales bacterium]